MDEHTVSVRYLVDDVEASIAFYTEVFGFEVLTSFPPAFADVCRGNLRLLLSGPKSSAEAEIARLQAAGASFRNDVVTGPGGSQVLVQDPSGNLIEIFQPAER